MFNARRVFLSMAFATIALGLVVHRHGLGMSELVRDVVGDALWAMMMVWWMGVFWPRMAKGSRLASAMFVSWTVEFSQLYRAPFFDNFRATTLGHLVLGSDFAARDLAAYAIGVIIAGVIEFTILDRLRGT